MKQSRLTAYLMLLTIMLAGCKQFTKSGESPISSRESVNRMVELAMSKQKMYADQSLNRNIVAVGIAEQYRMSGLGARVLIEDVSNSGKRLRSIFDAKTGKLIESETVSSNTANTELFSKAKFNIEAIKASDALALVDKAKLLVPDNYKYHSVRLITFADSGCDLVLNITDTADTATGTLTCYQAKFSCDNKGKIALTRPVDRTKTEEVNTMMIGFDIKDYAGLLIILLGVLMIVGAILHWDWLFEHNWINRVNSRGFNIFWVEYMFGRTAARFFMGILGIVVIVIGWILHNLLGR